MKTWSTFSTSVICLSILHAPFCGRGSSPALRAYTHTIQIPARSSELFFRCAISMRCGRVSLKYSASERASFLPGSSHTCFQQQSTSASMKANHAGISRSTTITKNNKYKQNKRRAMDQFSKRDLERLNACQPFSSIYLFQYVDQAIQ